MGGSTKGFRPPALGPMGELTEVASAKRAVLGVFTDNDEELEDFRVRTVTSGSFFSSERDCKSFLMGT